jgi:hypothetical protein
MKVPNASTSVCPEARSRKLIQRNRTSLADPHVRVGTRGGNRPVHDADDSQFHSHYLSAENIHRVGALVHKVQFSTHADGSGARRVHLARNLDRVRVGDVYVSRPTPHPMPAATPSSRGASEIIVRLQCCNIIGFPCRIAAKVATAKPWARGGIPNFLL